MNKYLLILLAVAVSLFTFHCSKDNPVSNNGGNPPVTNDSLIWSCDSLSNWGVVGALDTTFYIKNKSIHKVRADMEYIEINSFSNAYWIENYTHILDSANTYSFIDSGFVNPDSITFGFSILNTYNAMFKNIKIYKLN